MPGPTQDSVVVACPHCGHQQSEPRAAISTLCRKCRGHFRVQEVLNPPVRPVEQIPERKRISCFACGTELEVAVSAESTICKRCSGHIDLRDYRITSAVSKNFRTKGLFVVDPKGYVFNTEALVGEAVIKGRFHGKLTVERSLTIFSTAEFKGTFTAGRFVVPAENHFRWHELVRVVSAEIAGELAANLQVERTAVFRSTARMFGNVEASQLAIEGGAVVVGSFRIGLGRQGRAD
jgi:cytoskeletal protein CcmA (bactofilin family)